MVLTQKEIFHHFRIIFLQSNFHQHRHKSIKSVILMVVYFILDLPKRKAKTWSWCRSDQRHKTRLKIHIRLPKSSKSPVKKPNQSNFYPIFNLFPIIARQKISEKNMWKLQNKKNAQHEENSFDIKRGMQRNKFNWSKFCTTFNCDKVKNLYM